MKRKQKFRVGQRVQSIYDASHTFVIDRSMVPERIFHEKDSDRWWTKSELQALGAPENPATSFRLNGKDEMRGTHSSASSAITKMVPRIATSPPGEVRCLLLECGVLFQPKRKWQKFHSEACRRAHWKRNNQGAQTAITILSAVAGR